jgi:hypothetical protein
MDQYLQYLIQEEIYLVKEDQEKKLTNKTILLISSGGSEPLPEKIHDLLTNILHAIHLNLDEIILIDIKTADSEDNLLGKYQMNECRILGFLDSIPTAYQDIFKGREYTLYESEGFISLLADPLKEIDQNRSKKKILWDKLQELYQLKKD